MIYQEHNVSAGETKIIFDILGFGDEGGTITVNLNGPGARACIYGLFIGRKYDEFEIAHTVVHHAPDTQSEILVKGVLTGHARASYDSLIKMHPGVRNAEGHQKEDTLLLSKDARVHAVPNLEIAHNDVRCSHSVSTTNVDKEKMFFMNARGIETQEAMRELVRGHISSVFDKLEDENERARVIDLLDRFFPCQS